MLGLGRADEDARDLAVPQYPRQRHLGQRLAAGGGDFVQGAYLCQLFFGDDALLQETAIGADAAVLRDAVEVAVGQQTLRQRAEGDDALVQPDSSLFQAVLLDGAVKDGVAVLVDDEGDVELVEDGAGFFQRLTVVVGQAGIKRLAAAHRLRQSTHGLFQRVLFSRF